MSLLAAFAAVLLGVAALFEALGLAWRRDVFGLATRVVAALGAAALLPSLADPAARPLVALGVTAAALPRPLALLLGSAGAVVIALRAPAAEATPLALVLAGVAVATAAAAVSTTVESRLAGGLDAAWTATAGGAAMAVLLLALGRGSLLRWTFVLGSGERFLRVPEAGILLGLALLASLGGTLVLLAHRLAGSAPALARLVGQRLLLLAAGFALLGLGFAVSKGLSLDEAALAAGAKDVAGLVLVLGLLVVGLVVLLGTPSQADAAALESRGALETRIAAVLVVLVAAMAAGEGVLRQGTYTTPQLAGTMAAALLGAGAVQSTFAVTLLRRTLLLVGLLWLLA